MDAPTVSFIRVPKVVIDRHLLNRITPFIESVADREPALLDAQTVLDDILAGHAELWVIGDKEIQSIAVTQLYYCPPFNVLTIIAVAGDGEGQTADIVAQGMPLFMARAEELGCDRVRIMGRKGWLRYLKAMELPFKEYVMVDIHIGNTDV